MDTKIQNGSFLISTPDINYDIFFKSIIIISSTEKHEIVGFIINKKTKFFVHDFIKDLPSSKATIGATASPIWWNLFDGPP